MRRLWGRGAELPDRVRIIQAELDRFERPRYLEVGVYTGAVILSVRASIKVGVDPVIRIGALRRRLHPGARGLELEPLTSDSYFAGLAEEVRFDVVFIDGDHRHRQARRDIDNALKVLSSDGVVLVHDCSPPSEAAALADSEEALARGAAEWCGDVWRAIVALRVERPDLEVEVLDTDFGMGVIRRVPADRGQMALTGVSAAELTYGEMDSDRGRYLGLRPPIDGPTR